MSLEQPMILSATAGLSQGTSRGQSSASSPLPTAANAPTYSIIQSTARLAVSRPSSTTSSNSSSALLGSAQSLNNIPTLNPTSNPQSPPPSAEDALSSSQIQSPPSTTPDAELQMPIMGLEDSADVDQQILEALKSKDRLYVLKLGEIMEGIINDRTKGRADVSPATSYQRLLVHRCSAYYKLSPETESTTKVITVSLTVESRVPSRRLCELVPVELTAQPTFKIMRRSAPGRHKSQSQAGSVAGEDGDLSDIEASETGSMGGRSNATGGSNKKRMTIEEREAAYKEARTRIFMDFEDKDKDSKDSASSSTLSLVSGSSSASATGGSSSAGDFEDFVTTETESEWSAPVTREKKESKRNGGGNSSASSSSRSLRPNAPAFAANGSGSSRGSRAPSPSFKYASLYEPAPSAASPYDGSQQQQSPQQVMSPPYNPYMYQQYGQPPPQGYMPPAYPYYPPYPYQQPVPPPPQSNTDASSPGAAEMYPPPHQVAYGQPYPWHNTQPSTSPQPVPAHAMNPPQGQYPPPFIPGVQYTYPMPGYYQPPPGAPAPPTLYSPDNMNRNGFNGSGSSGQSRASSRNSAGSNGAKQRGGAPPSTRSPWSYGSAVPIGGYSFNSPSGSGEIVGPRLSSRRASSNSAGSSGHRSSAGDEASSTASSSTTSSSSRRTYTSNSSQQHPLPPRPDWAVGLKPQGSPTNSRHIDHVPIGSHSIGSISPSRSGNGGLPNMPQRQSQQHRHLPPPVLQATDFPPLAGVSAAPEKRAPTGAWTNSSRSILMPNQGQTQVHPPGNALVQYNQHPPHPNNNNGTHVGNNNDYHPHQPQHQQHPSQGIQNYAMMNNNLNMNYHANGQRHDDADRGFERPPPKTSAELFNPKVVRRPANNTNGAAAVANKYSNEDNNRDKERIRETVVGAILVGQMGSMTLDGAGKVEDVPKESQSAPVETAT